ncbi:MAG: helix-turn-helix domain-containing protein [Bergeyella zoohelcum]|nr:helix-turn-helix domain-containing protein [Bergeyella zoohelcum]
MNQQIFQLAEYTNRHIFLTGKAGTGKTTFLNDFVKRTEKKFIVLGTTGIAAINAGGVTIHSMFGLPLRTFIPTLERIDQTLANNIPDLIKHFKYRESKLKLLREVEIIIIDEASMLRADVLDMMDFSLRHIRRNQQPFGGAQMLFIGDLHQLSPVVKDESFFLKYYTSPFFFSAKALEKVNLLTVELTKVYRQKDENFLTILNAIRDGDRKNIDFDLLNSRYNPDFEPKKETYIHLTSHNRIAQSVNQEKLNQLKGKSYSYKAKIIGDFKENQYPNEEILELKVGAQVMFIRNDATSERKYYNGSLAEILRLDDDEVVVRIEDSHEEYKVKKEVWENKNYTLDADKNVKEELLGSFEQFPLRLAWAVTIHKSQGLTFDRVIIDAGNSFASGQVYVALSRCRTLEGIVLKSKITPEIIFNDQRVSGFQDSTHANDKMEDIISAEKYDYSIMKIINRTDCRWVLYELQKWYQEAIKSKKLDLVKAIAFYNSAKQETEQLNEIFTKFEKVLLTKTQQFILGKEEWSAIENKAKGAVTYFFNKINEKVFEPLKEFYSETKGVVGLKGYNEQTKTLIDDLQDYLTDVQKLKLLDTHLFDEKKKKEISTQIAKTPTHIISWKLFEEGKSIAEIAKERGVLTTTIMGHFSKFAETGILTLEDLQRIVPKNNIEIFEKLYQKQQFESLNEWKQHLPNEFEYGEIRLLWTYFQNKGVK